MVSISLFVFNSWHSQTEVAAFHVDVPYSFYEQLKGLYDSYKKQFSTPVGVVGKHKIKIELSEYIACTKLKYLLFENVMLFSGRTSTELRSEFISDDLDSDTYAAFAYFTYLREPAGYEGKIVSINFNT